MPGRGMTPVCMQIINLRNLLAHYGSSMLLGAQGPGWIKWRPRRCYGIFNEILEDDNIWGVEALLAQRGILNNRKVCLATI